MSDLTVDSELYQVLKYMAPTPIVLDNTLNWVEHDYIMYTSINVVLRDCIVKLLRILGTDLVNIRTYPYYENILNSSKLFELYGEYITVLQTYKVGPQNVMDYNKYRPTIFVVPITPEVIGGPIVNNNPVDTTRELLFGKCGDEESPELKLCAVCGKFKAFTDKNFILDTSQRDKVTTVCKACLN